MPKAGNLISLAAAILTLAAASACVDTDNTLGSNLVPSNQDISIKTLLYWESYFTVMSLISMLGCIMDVVEW